MFEGATVVLRRFYAAFTFSKDPIRFEPQPKKCDGCLSADSVSASPAPRGLVGRVGWGWGDGEENLHIVSASARPELSGWKRNLKLFNLSRFVDVDDFFLFVWIFLQMTADFWEEMESFMNKLIVRGPVEIRERLRCANLKGESGGENGEGNENVEQNVNALLAVEMKKPSAFRPWTYSFSKLL